MTNILMIIVAFLAIVTLIQILRVSELMSDVQKQDVNQVNAKDNIFNSQMMLIVGALFLISFVWQYFQWRHLLLPEASSEHGVIIDELMTFTMWLIVFVFLITQPLLFWFGYKYAKHQNGLTNSTFKIIALLILPFYWYSIYNTIDFSWDWFSGYHLSLYQELYFFSLDFGWILGLLDFITSKAVLSGFLYCFPLLIIFILFQKKSGNETAYYFAHNNKLEIIWTVVPAIVLTGVILYGLSTWNKITNADVKGAQVIELYAKQFQWTARYSGADNKLGSAHYSLVSPINPSGTNALGVDTRDNDVNAAWKDDIITTPVDNVVHLVKGQPVLLKFRSQDVIHSAFLPHFRVQMNCVPGMTTQFAFTPTKTTAEMKGTEGEDFDYVLLCNKICGASHYNMQMKFIVETQEEYDTWMSSQKTLSEKVSTQTVITELVTQK